MVKVGYAEGKCPRCGKILRRKYPADLAVCDCFKLCPLCGAEMTSFNPDLTPSTYGAGKGFALKGQAAKEPEWNTETIMVCHNHKPPYYSSQKPVEVKLK